MHQTPKLNMTCQIVLIYNIISGFIWFLHISAKKGDAGDASEKALLALLRCRAFWEPEKTFGIPKWRSVNSQNGSGNAVA